MSTEAESLPILDFVEEVLAFYRSERVSVTTYRKIQTVLGDVMRLRGISTVADLTPKAVDAYVRAMTAKLLKPASIKSNLAQLRVICTYAVGRGYLASNPVDSVKRWVPYGYDDGAADRPPQDLPLEPDDVSRLLLHLLERSTTWEGFREFALTVVIVYLGLHFGQAIRLRWVDYSAGRRTLRVKGARPERRVPAKVLEVLDQWQRLCDRESPTIWMFPGVLLENPWEGGNARSKPIARIRTRGREVGIEGLTFRQLRQFWIAEGERVELPAFEAAPHPDRDNCRHKRPKTGPKPKDPAPVLSVSLGRSYVMVRGKWIQAVLTAGQFRVLKAMVDRGCLTGERITGPELDALLNSTCSATHIRDLRKIPALRDVILPSGSKGVGYGLAPE